MLIARNICLSLSLVFMLIATLWPLVNGVERGFRTFDFAQASASFWAAWVSAFVLFIIVGVRRYIHETSWRNVRTLNLAIALVVLGVDGAMVRLGGHEAIGLGGRSEEVLSWIIRMYVGWSAVAMIAFIRPHDVSSIVEAA